jgi:hypothetical protein
MPLFVDPDYVRSEASTAPKYPYEPGEREPKIKAGKSTVKRYRRW